MATFKAYRIFNEDGKVQARLVEMTLDELDAGEVVFRTAFSSVNFKMRSPARCGQDHSDAFRASAASTLPAP
jgi:hypothetical protein